MTCICIYGCNAEGGGWIGLFCGSMFLQDLSFSPLLFFSSIVAMSVGGGTSSLSAAKLLRLPPSMPLSLRSLAPAGAMNYQVPDLCSVSTVALTVGLSLSGIDFFPPESMFSSSLFPSLLWSV